MDDSLWFCRVVATDGTLPTTKPCYQFKTMNTHPIKKDSRWTVTREYTGKPRPQFVIRFCGDWIDSRPTYPAAVLRAVGAKAVRDGAAIVEEVRG